MIKDKIRQLIINSVAKVAPDFELGDIVIDKPKSDFGDYATNVAFVSAKELKKDPKEVAGILVEAMLKAKTVEDGIADIKVEGGYINFFLDDALAVSELERIAEDDNYGSNDTFAGKKVMIEFTDPNPFKEFHVGHLMSNAIGESISRLYDASGAEVLRANYQGDVGVHVAKAVWGMMQLPDKMPADNEELAIKVAYMGKAYAQGNNAYEDDPKAKEEIDELNQKIYKREGSEINDLYDKGREWSLAYFETIYQRLGTKFEHYFFESEMSDAGLEIVNANPDVFPESQGARIFKGEDYGLHTRVFVSSKGLPTYEAKELGLNKIKFEKYHPDISLIVTGNDIVEYFKVTLKAMEQIMPDIAKKTQHVPHGFLRLSSGKMSSRKGDIITAEGLIEDVKKIIYEKMHDREELNEDDRRLVAERVAIGAIKYSILKQSPGRDIVFDFQKSLSFEGDSGPYLQYTYARLFSILRKAEEATDEAKDNASGGDISELKDAEELKIIKHLMEFPDALLRATQLHAPNHVALYVYELANLVNTYYEKTRILKDENESRRKARLTLIKTVNKTLERGLYILGIQVLEKI
ncbi:MAG: arginine--tRNA ligase [Parcubacteria group bacterium]